ncbi:MAG TPA: dihydropteroate synthase [Bacteroidales bacterium]|nr:dihydropteroate synthase [Bacteroidales bacterium]HBZ21937.1 dihydropteroate synthase [Bacteroidales bacterium]
MMAFKPRFINVRGNLVDLSLPKVMGIINVTPDSFYTESRVSTEEGILRTASKMIEDGVDFIDIGGYSSRPGAANIPPDEERSRVVNAMKIVSREFPDAVISIDTFRSEIAMEAILEYGASIINDISGGEADKKMFSVVEKLQVPYIMMHMQGIPGTMQKNPVYDDVVADILKWFGERIIRLQSMGVRDIIIDPGFGFGKRAEHNFDMLRRLGDFAIAGLPLLVGFSRKSMIWKTLGITPLEALNGTSVLNTVALMNGADILRVHDVKEAVQAVKLVEEIKNSSK